MNLGWTAASIKYSLAQSQLYILAEKEKLTGSVFSWFGPLVLVKEILRLMPKIIFCATDQQLGNVLFCFSLMMQLFNKIRSFQKWFAEISVQKLTNLQSIASNPINITGAN